MQSLSILPAPVVPRFAGVSPAAIESLKWVALAAMLAEHGMRYAVGELAPWAYEIGRVAFPLFAFALALGMRGRPPATLLAVTVRMLAWAAVAQAAMQVVGRPPTQLNVLFTFALGLAAAAVLGSGRPLFAQALALAVIVVASACCEFGLVGAGFVAACIAFARAKDPPGAAWVACAALLVGLAIPNHSHFALAAVPLALVIGALPIRLPRLRGAFYWAYALQFPVLAGMRVMIA